MKFWNSNKVIEATGGAFGGDPFNISTVNTDTRTLKSGELFVALAGDNFDGHHYLQEAMEAGAAGALVSYIPANAPQYFPLIKVEDTFKALQDLARYRRNHTQAKIIAITGSVGKTSAKEMLKLALSEYGETYATQGNYNNHIGLPICLCNLPKTSEYAIFEMGMNHAGEIAFLSEIAKPHLSLITAVEAVHLEFFDSVEGIAHAKAEIFEGMEGGLAILPADNPYYDILQQAATAKNCVITKFGADAQSDLRLVSPTVEYEYARQLRGFSLATRGMHWPKAALGVLACIAALKLPLGAAEKALAQYREQGGRGEVRAIAWKTGLITLMDDAYNASPVSMQAALATLSTLGEGRKLAILGEMLELGETSDSLHAALAVPIAEYKIDAVITVGVQMQALAEALQPLVHLAHFSHVEEAARVIETLVKPGDVVLCKGSHGSGVYRLVEALKQQQK